MAAEAAAAEILLLLVQEAPLLIALEEMAELGQIEVTPLPPLEHQEVEEEVVALHIDQEE